jgi:hypothetical protein
MDQTTSRIAVRLDLLGLLLNTAEFSAPLGCKFAQGTSTESVSSQVSFERARL